MTRKDYLLIVVGMLGVVAYLCHVLLGDFLLTGHNIVTMSIERITQIKTPYTIYMKILLWIFSGSMIILSFGMYSIYKKTYDNNMKYIWLFAFLPSQILFFINSNMLSDYYIELSIICILLCIITFFPVSILYFKNNETKKFGLFLFIVTAILVILAMFYFFTVFIKINIIGISQRLMILSLLIYIFSISNYECFNDKHNN